MYLSLSSSQPCGTCKNPTFRYYRLNDCYKCMVKRSFIKPNTCKICDYIIGDNGCVCDFAKREYYSLEEALKVVESIING